MAEDNNLEPERKDPEPQPGKSPDEDTPAEGTEPSSASLKGLTPGQRLAAKKAQKAVEKREFKEELKRKDEVEREEETAEAQRILGQGPSGPIAPDNVQRAAGDFTEFVQVNRGRILGGIALVVVGALSFIGLRGVLGQGSAEQGTAIAQALEIESAPIDPDNTSGKNEDGKPVFKSREERSQKAAAAFAAAAQSKPDSVAAGWAQLAEATAKLELGDASASEAAFKRVLDAHKGNIALETRALEGVAIATEATGKAEDAAKRYEDLKRLDQDSAEYHLARIKLEKGDREGAKTLLKGVYDRLSNRTEGGPPSRYLKSEVESRLAEIDSTLVDKGTSGSDGQQFSQEELQRLIEQLRQQQQGGGAE